MSKAWLIGEYVQNGRDCVQIGKELGKDPKTIWAWMKHYGIPTRPRGCAERLRPGRPPGFHLSPETKAKIRAARLRDGGVPYLKNGKHWLTDAPRGSHPNWKGGLTPARQALYSSEEWKSTARKVWKRDRRTCQQCGKKKSPGVPFDIHHIVSFECAELRIVLSNLVLLCESCHYWAHGSANTEKKWIQPCP